MVSASTGTGGTATEAAHGLICEGGLLEGRAVELFKSFYEQGNPNGEPPVHLLPPPPAARVLSVALVCSPSPTSICPSALTVDQKFGMRRLLPMH